MFKKRNKRIKNDSTKKIYFGFFSSLIIICLFFYGYFVRSTIVNIVTRQNMESELSTLSSDVLDLESTFIKSKNSITEELAFNLGFTNVTNKKFVTKDNNNLGLSLMTQEF